MRVGQVSWTTGLLMRGANLIDTVEAVCDAVGYIMHRDERMEFPTY